MANDPQVWMAYALDDLEVARRALGPPSPIPHGASFHAQQCAEKALKAFLVQRGEQVPHIHDLDELRVRFTKLDSTFAELREDCNLLNEFGSPSRYPPEAQDQKTTVQEAKDAISLAERIAGFIRERLPATEQRG